MAQIDDLLRYLKQHGGSDLHLAAGIDPRVRVNGELRAVAGTSPLDDAGLRKLMREITSDDQWASYSECHDLDFAYSLEGVARFLDVGIHVLGDAAHQGVFQPLGNRQLAPGQILHRCRRTGRAPVALGGFQ